MKRGKIKSVFGFKTTIGIILALIFVSVLASALDTEATGFRVDPNTKKEITVHSECRQITNSATSSIFIPTKTSTEWLNFKTNYPQGYVTITNCASGTLQCYGSSTSSIALSYSFSNSLSSQVSIFRGNTKLITYTGSSGSGTYTSSGLGSDNTYTFYLRDGTTTSSRLLAQVSCSTEREEREDPPEEPPDYSDLPNRILDGSDDNGNGKVICTELYSTGVLDEETYKMDVKYASEHFSKEALHGYQAWAIPVVKFMRKSPEETERTVIPLVNSFMEEIAYRSGKRETGNEVGKLFLDEGVPLFERIGKYIDEPDWRSLFDESWLENNIDPIYINIYKIVIGDNIFSIINIIENLLQNNKYDEIVENYFTEQKVREMFYDAERRGGNSQLAVAKALVENLEDAVENIESLIKSA